MRPRTASPVAALGDDALVGGRRAKPLIERATAYADDRLWPGRVLSGNWRLCAPIGVGGMASVWSAVDRRGRRVALKILREELSHDEVTRQRFSRECYVQNRIHHPSVTRVLDDAVTDDGLVLLVMELLDGHTLRAVLDEAGRLSPVRVAAIALEILDGLEAAHAVDVIHRDIKPENVMLTRAGVIKLLDFGIARLNDGQRSPHFTCTGAMLGTPAYMAPEQALGLQDAIDARTDLFAVGATMWRLLTGGLVHRASTLQQLLIAAGTAQANPIRAVLPDLDSAIAHVIDKALRFDPDERWSTAGRMRCALAAALEASPADTMATPLEPRAAPSAQLTP